MQLLINGFTGWAFARSANRAGVSVIDTAITVVCAALIVVGMVAFLGK